MKKLRMVKFYSIMAFAFLSGCAPLSKPINKIPEFNSVKILDLTKYSKQGFLITPETLKGNYESVGQLYCKILPEANRKFVSNGYEPTESEKQRGITGENTNFDFSPKLKWVTKEISVEKAIDQAYKTAIEMGGNAIMEFSIKSIVVEMRVNYSELVLLNGYEVTGFIINKKE